MRALMLCAAGDRASAAPGAASPAGPALVALRLKVAPLADLGAADSDNVGRGPGPAPVAA